jgi:hypothetical protein
MAKQIDTITALVYELAEYLKTALPELEDVKTEFPTANDELNYPCITITAGNPGYVPLDPYLFEQGETLNHRTLAKYVIGEYDATLQLDLWTGSKPERAALRERLNLALNPRAHEGFTGLGLMLKQYHNSWANLSSDGVGIADAEASSQRGEWRATINVLANCRAISVADQPVIETTEVTVGVTETDLETE